MDPSTESALQAYRAGLPAQGRAGPLDFGSTTVAPDQWNKLVGDEGGDVRRFNAAVSNVGGPTPTVTQTPILLRDDKGQFGNATLFKVTAADGQSHLVDGQGATYADVDDYLQNNQISDSWSMVRPAQPGAADGTPQQLVSGPAHNTTFMQQVGKVGDKVAGPAMIAGGALVLGASAAGEVGTAGLATPAAVPAAMWGGGLIATGAAWTAGRSGQDLINRYQHGRSLSYADPQARADYLGLVGAVGGGAGALAKGLGAPLAAAAGDRIALATGAAQLGGQAGQLHDNWQNLTPEQRIQHGTELAAGVGMMAMPLANRSVPEGGLRSYGAGDGSAKANDGSVALSPQSVRLSQTSVNGAAERIESMKADGWVGPPIDVVRMPDGNLTTIDNTRVVAAAHAGIDIRALVHPFDEPLPNQEQVDRLTTPKGMPATWGDAVNLRIGKQSATYRGRYPMGSPWTGWSGN